MSLLRARRAAAGPLRALLAGLALLAAAGCARCGPGGGTGPTAPGEGRNVVLITVDTLRADRLGCYGARQPATPEMDALAASGVLFEDALAVAPLTLPAHASLLTGRHPASHGVHNNLYYVLPPQEETLAEILKARGYRTAAFVGAFPLSARFGTAQGFDLYDESFRPGGAADVEGEALVERTAPEVNRPAIAWLTGGPPGRPPESPFFLWIHYFDPHDPYEPPADLARLYPGDPYAGEVALVDRAVGEVLRALREAGLEDRTAVVLVGDHGEALGEHGEKTHGYFVYEATMRVPLIVRAPWLATAGGGEKAPGAEAAAGEAAAPAGAAPAPRRVPQVVSQVDVLPTLLDLLEMEIPAGVQGRSLRPLLEGRELLPLPAMGECAVPWLDFRFSPLLALREGNLKIIDAPRPELYDLAADPGETKNLAAEKPEEIERLRRLLRERHALAREAVKAAPADAARTATDEELEKLAALGYVGGAGGGAAEIPEPSATMRDPKDGLKVSLLFEEAAAEFASGRFAKAAESFRALARELPDSPSVRYQLGQALLMAAGEAGTRPDGEARFRELIAEARRTLEALVEAEPGDARARMRLGQAYEMMEENDKAIEQYRASAELSVATPEAARVLLGRLLFRTGDPDGGIEQLRRAVASSPGTLSWRRDLAAMLDNTGQGAKVEELMLDYTRALPNDPRSWNELGSVRLRQRNLEGAIEAFERALAADPSNVVAHTNLGGLMIIKRDYGKAEEHYRSAAAAAPELAEARLGLARAVLFAGREEEGRRLLEEFGSEHPEESRVHSYWGLYLREVKGEEPAAKAAFLRALGVNPHDPIALQEIGARP